MNSTCCLKAFHSPTRPSLSQLNLGFSTQYSFYCSSVYLSGFIWVLFIRMLLDWNTSHFWHHVISLYGRIYQTETAMWGDMFYSATITLAPPVTLVLHGLLHLHPLSNIHVLLHNIVWHRSNINGAYALIRKIQMWSNSLFVTYISDR